MSRFFSFGPVKFVDCHFGKKTMIRTAILLALLSAMFGCKNQKATNSMWTESKMKTSGTANDPVRYKTYELKADDLLSSLAECGDDLQHARIVKLPDPQGEMREFQIWKSKVANPELIRKYPNLQTYQGVAKGANQVRVRLENSDNGIQAMVIDGDATWYIAPDKEIENTYIVYYKKDLPADAKNFWSEKVIYN